MGDLFSFDNVLSTTDGDSSPLEPALAPTPMHAPAASIDEKIDQPAYPEEESRPEKSNKPRRLDSSIFYCSFSKVGVSYNSSAFTHPEIPYQKTQVWTLSTCSQK